jgi:hypothetical protein
MAGLIINVIGIINDIGNIVLGILQLVPLDANKVSSGSESIVRVGVGIYDSESQLGGDTPGITVWNENGHRLGSTQPSINQIDAGSFLDIVVPQNPPDQQPTYLKIEGRNNSICVAYLSHTWPDGIKRGWLGDMGSQCGMQWYYSKIYVTEANGTQYQVCMRTRRIFKNHLTFT